MKRKTAGKSKVRSKSNSRTGKSGRPKVDLAGPTLRQSMEAAKCLPQFPFLKEYLGYCFFRVALRIRAAVDQALAQFNVSAPQFGMLVVLREAGPMTQIELGSQMAIDKATMVRMIDNLETHGLLTRAASKEDRRAKYLEITTLGRQASKKMDEARKKAEMEVLSILSEEQRAQLREIITKLISQPIK